MRFLPIALIALAAIGCSGNETTSANNGTNATGPDAAATPAATTPSGPPAGPFSLAVSPYPAWTTYEVMVELGIIDGNAGALGTVEKKWNVDIVIKSGDYVPTLEMYMNSTADAVAVTNTDALALADKRNGVAIIPTSTSFGADALIVEKGTTWATLKGTPISGAELSVSDYLLYRCAQNAGVNWEDYRLTNMDPALASAAMLQKQQGVRAIVAWNPFVMNVLEGRPGEVETLCDSTSIPGEIVDMVVVGADTAAKPGGDAFAKAITEAYYLYNEMLADPARADELLVALGERFSKITDANVMRRLTRETKFYGTPDQGAAAFGSEAFSTTWPRIAEFSVSHGLVRAAPNVIIGHDAPPAGAHWLRVDPSYMEAVAAGM